MGRGRKPVVCLPKALGTAICGAGVCLAAASVAAPE